MFSINFEKYSMTNHQYEPVPLEKVAEEIQVDWSLIGEAFTKWAESNYPNEYRHDLGPYGKNHRGETYNHYLRIWVYYGSTNKPTMYPFGKIHHERRWGNTVKGDPTYRTLEDATGYFDYNFRLGLVV